MFKPLSANPTKWSNTLKKFVGNSWLIAWVCVDHFLRLALKVYNWTIYYILLKLRNFLEF